MGHAADLPGTSAESSAAPRSGSSAAGQATRDGKLRELRLNGAPGGSSPTSTGSWQAETARFALVAAGFGLLVLIVRMFQFESVRFGNLMVLAWIGFVIHHFLPLKLRLPFFSALSIAGIYLLAGGWITVAVVSGGLVLIALCHLPIPFAVRVGLVVLAGGVLAALRVEWLKTPITPAAWMVVGSVLLVR